MRGIQINEISRFIVAGINYKTADAGLRSQFAIGPAQYKNLFTLAPCYGVNELLVLSTCNRTEIYGYAEEASHLAELLCTQTQGSFNTFMNIGYIRKGIEAVEHVFEVAAGLDSQILGDYEIVGQMRKAVKFSKENGFVGVYLDRLLNSALQSSKEIKNTTGLSGGSVSVAFAAVKYLGDNVNNIADKKILLLGTGKIGRSTCKNLVDHLGAKNITLINRTGEKAVELARELGLCWAAVEDLQQQVAAADIILVATNSTDPVIFKSQLANGGEKLIIDLSIPFNVEENTRSLSNITLVNVDELSKVKDETLHKRRAEIPKAKAIIAAHIKELTDWFNMRRNVPVLKAIRDTLESIPSSVTENYSSNNTAIIKIAGSLSEDRIQKVINGMAVKMRSKDQRGCIYIEAINEYIATGTN